MIGGEYKLKTGKYFGRKLIEVPPSYLLYLYDNDYVMEQAAKTFVVNNKEELRKLTKK